MISPWLRVLSGLTPVFIILSIGLLLFGVYRLLNSYNRMKETKEEEDRQRREFLAKMDLSKVSPKTPKNN